MARAARERAERGKSRRGGGGVLRYACLASGTRQASWRGRDLARIARPQRPRGGPEAPAKSSLLRAELLDGHSAPGEGQKPPPKADGYAPSCSTAARATSCSAMSSAPRS